MLHWADWRKSRVMKELEKQLRCKKRRWYEGMAGMNAEGNLDLDTVIEHEIFCVIHLPQTWNPRTDAPTPLPLPPPLSIIHIEFCFSLINLWRGFDWIRTYIDMLLILFSCTCTYETIIYYYNIIISVYYHLDGVSRTSGMCMCVVLSLAQSVKHQAHFIICFLG